MVVPVQFATLKCRARQNSKMNSSLSMIIFILIPFLCYLFCQPGEFTFSVLYAKTGTSLIIKKTRINVLFTFFQNIINTPNYCKFQVKMNSTGKNLNATGRRRCCLELQKLIMAKTYLLIYLCHQNSWCTSNLQTDRSSWSHIIPKTAPLKLYRYSAFLSSVWRTKPARRDVIPHSNFFHDKGISLSRLIKVKVMLDHSYTYSSIRHMYSGSLTTWLDFCKSFFLSFPALTEKMQYVQERV